MTVVVIAEKPSVARSIAEVLGATKAEPGACRGNGYVVTWAIGHLVGLAEPHEMNPEWKTWRYPSLPMLPKKWELKVLDKTRDHFTIVAGLLNAREIDSVVCATDAGREGELIFRYIYRMAGCNKPVDRLWISSLTPDAIRAGFKKLRAGKEFDNLAAAAEARSRADWLVGMNFSRVYTLRHGPDLLSVGRVQTPTLAMLVEREKAIQAFVPAKYCEVVATFGKNDDSYSGVWFDRAEVATQGAELARRLPANRVLAQAICARCVGVPAKVIESTGIDKSLLPPLLYDLTELQRHANRLYGMTAQQTLTAAQALYEHHKLLSYPRTDSRHLSASVAASIQSIVAAVAPSYGAAIAAGTGTAPLSRRFVDDTKVTDHHAIIPTHVPRATKRLAPDEGRVYDLVCRRLLMAWADDYKTRTTKVVTRVPADAAAHDPADLFHTCGTVVIQAGWKILDIERENAKKEPGEEERRLPDGLAVQQVRPVTEIETKDKETSPPKRFTDATLLTAMESAGRTLDSRELEDAMREHGLGTPATRAAIIETLLSREYVVRQGKSLRAADKGIALIGVVHDSVKSPQLTGEWELALKNIERGRGSLTELMAGIERLVIDVVEELRSAPIPDPVPRGLQPVAGDGIKSVSQSELAAILNERFGHQAFRPNQEEVCKAVTAGADALLVMPTGSGKSLCYQLPGIARGGTTLVISPLIALMEDQTAKLCAMGLRAERIHSGRSREQSRAVCRAYLDGTLDFLAIAPERLSVPGFAQMLARRPPILIAVDEAHCISHWGHDFRPDYRLLGGYLPLFRPAPILALTATATVRVQDDILAQLEIPQARRFIHGFRRDNLAIEVVERGRGERLDVAAQILGPRDRRPAVVYVPSRKMSEQVAESLEAASFSAAPYHAGLDAQTRSRTQETFQRGEIDVVVATIAFGMGIDKADIRTVIHLGLPSTVEGYYQEIGRAGRDGLPARALLFYSYGDRKMHESFLTRDYPETRVLEKMRARVSQDGVDRAQLLAASGLELAAAEAALTKLWIHGGVTIDSGDVVRPGEAHWQPRYEAIRTYRYGQLDEVLDFAQSGGCRMARLIRHFGETRDSKPCGLCDACRPRDCVGRRFCTPTKAQLSLAEDIVAELAMRDGLAIGTLLRNLSPSGNLERRELENVLAALARAGALVLTEDEFEKDGEVIRFRRARLLPNARGALRAESLLMDDVDQATTVRSGKSKPKPKLKPKRQKTHEISRGSVVADDAEAIPDEALVERLRQWRKQLAKTRGVPAFIILHDKTLYAIAAAKPVSTAALLQINGVGSKLVAKYGAAIVQVVGG